MDIDKYAGIDSIISPLRLIGSNVPKNQRTAVAWGFNLCYYYHGPGEVLLS